MDNAFGAPGRTGTWPQSRHRDRRRHSAVTGIAGFIEGNIVEPTQPRSLLRRRRSRGALGRTKLGPTLIVGPAEPPCGEHHEPPEHSGSYPRRWARADGVRCTKCLLLQPRRPAQVPALHQQTVIALGGDQVSEGVMGLSVHRRLSYSMSLRKRFPAVLRTARNGWHLPAAAISNRDGHIMRGRSCMLHGGERAIPNFHIDENAVHAQPRTSHRPIAPDHQQFRARDVVHSQTNFRVERRTLGFE